MKSLIDMYKTESNIIFQNVSNDEILNLWDCIKTAYLNNNTIFMAGNGGNVGYIANMYTDFLIHPFVNDNKNMKIGTQNKRLKCINLTDSSSTITGIANDLGYNNIFAEQLEIFGQPGDIFIGISGSGTSKNIIECIKVCEQNEIIPFIITKNSNVTTNKIVINGISEFPGQIGKNMANFHFEDCISKITHIITGLLKQYVTEHTT